MNYPFESRNLMTSSYDMSSSFSASSLNFSFLRAMYVSLETRICGKDEDCVFMVNNNCVDNKDYVNHVISIDTFINKEVI